MKIKWKEMVPVLLLFIIGIVFHYYYGTFDKSVELLPDELRYYCMAKSIYLGDGFTFKGLDLSYNKFGYMLFLVPFFAIESGVFRIKMITLFSSLIMMTSIFPLWGIMNRLKLSIRAKHLILIVFTIVPGLMMSATYMAEIVYWPIFFLFIYLWIINRTKKNYLLSVLMGMIAYYGYATKEIFLGILVSIVLFELFYPIIEYVVHPKSNRGNLKERYNVKSCINTGIIIISFVVIHIILKLTIFRGMHNSYDNQAGLDILLSMKNIAYMAYGFIYYIAAICISVFVMPIIAPIILSKKLDSDTRALHFFNLINVIVFTSIVVFTITVREDFGELIPRIHFRYFDPLLLIFIVTFFVCLDREDVSLNRSKSTYITIGAVLIAAFAVFRGVDIVVYIDQFSMNWVDLLMKEFGDTYGVVITDIVVTLVVIATTMLLIKSKTLVIQVASFLTMLVVCIVNTISAKQIIVSYMQRDTDVINSSVDVNNKLKSVDGGILYISAYSDKEKCIDTYFDRNKDIYFVDWNYTKGFKEGTYNVKDISLPLQFGLWQLEYDNISSIEYVLVESGYKPEGTELTNMTLDQELSNNDFLIYKNNDSSKLSFENVK